MAAFLTLRRGLRRAGWRLWLILLVCHNDLTFFYARAVKQNPGTLSSLNSSGEPAKPTRPKISTP
jgi:hypothetical protein